eukprot:3084186-Prymnesium_polylepis.1
MPNLSDTMSFEMKVLPPPILGRSAVPKPYEGALRCAELCCVPSMERRAGVPVADIITRRCFKSSARDGGRAPGLRSAAGVREIAPGGSTPSSEGGDPAHRHRVVSTS